MVLLANSFVFFEEVKRLKISVAHNKPEESRNIVFAQAFRNSSAVVEIGDKRIGNNVQLKFTESRETVFSESLI